MRSNTSRRASKTDCSNAAQTQAKHSNRAVAEYPLPLGRGGLIPTPGTI
jgi:hypothetical protein